MIPARHLVTLLLAFGVGACGAEPKEQKTAESGDATAKTGKKKKPTAPSDDAGGEAEGTDGPGEAESSDGTGGDGGGTTDGGTTDGGNAAKGEEYFNLSVVPVLQVKCIGCHADPRLPVEVRAPLSIYSYKLMKGFLGDGKGSQDNVVFNKMHNIASHTGGDRCQGGPNATPCKDIIDWWHVEFGEDTGGSVKLGRITDLTALGKVYGYAFDPADTTLGVTVKFYADGDKDTGIAAGSTVANIAGSDNNTPGSHAFNVTLPDALKNGKVHTLMAYAVIGGVELALSDDPLPYTAYSFTTAGRDYYNANVKGAMGGCTGCHNVDYETQYYSMISPSPAKGATKINNQLVNKPSLSNGAMHGGGKLCGSVNASPCSVFQQWWTIEFGP